MLTRVLSLALATVYVCAGQSPFNLNAKQQCIAVVPLQGAGTLADPIRPLLLPAGRPPKRDAKGIEGYTWRFTDDKKAALVIFTASSRSAFDAILRDARIKAFVKGKDKPDVAEREIRRYVKDFAFDNPHGLRRGQAK